MKFLIIILLSLLWGIIIASIQINVKKKLIREWDIYKALPVINNLFYVIGALGGGVLGLIIHNLWDVL